MQSDFGSIDLQVGYQHEQQAVAGQASCGDLVKPSCLLSEYHRVRACGRLLITIVTFINADCLLPAIIEACKSIMCAVSSVISA